MLLYTASTLYHAIPNINAKRVLQILDHAMIYVLIAGSYTPFCLITLKGWVGIALCIAVWTIAVVGVSLQKILLKRSDWINCVLYLAMGWLVVLAFDPLVTALPEGGLWLLVALPTAWASFSTSGKNSPTGMRSGTSSCFWARPCSFSPFCCTSFRGYSIQERRNR